VAAQAGSGWPVFPIRHHSDVAIAKRLDAFHLEIGADRMRPPMHQFDTKRIDNWIGLQPAAQTSVWVFTGLAIG